VYSELAAPVGRRDLFYLTKYKTINVHDVTFRRLRVSIVVVEKVIRITHSGCVSLALVNQNAERMRRIILLSVACPGLPHFSILSHEWHDFRKRKKSVECKMSVLYFCDFETFLVLKRIRRDTVVNVHRFSCKYPPFLSNFNEI